jgi:drug/metabolite transporter (DMT)-like permease
MKVLKKKHGFLIVIALFFMVAGLMFVLTKDMAQITQGDVALEMAKLLEFEVTTDDDAVAALQAVGIAPEGGWNISTTATPGFIGSLYSAVNNAISQGMLTPPAALGNASALVAAAAAAAGMDSTTAVNAVTAAGGNQTSASHGASYGTVVTLRPAPTPTVVTPTPSGPSGGAPGGGGGTTSPSS